MVFLIEQREREQKDVVLFVMFYRRNRVASEDNSLVAVKSSIKSILFVMLYSNRPGGSVSCSFLSLLVLGFSSCLIAPRHHIQIEYT